MLFQQHGRTPTERLWQDLFGNDVMAATLGATRKDKPES